MANKFSGVVVNKSGAQTIKVRVDRKVTIPIYGKQITRSKKYLVHDPKNKYQIGDKVFFNAVKPISKKKRFAVAGE